MRNTREVNSKVILFIGGSLNNTRRQISAPFLDGFGMLSPTGIPGVVLAEDYQQSPAIHDLFVCMSSDVIGLHAAAEVN